MEISRWNKEKVRMLRANGPSGKAYGVVVTHMQQAVQHLNKYGGMAGITAEEEGSWKDRPRQLAGCKSVARTL